MVRVRSAISPYLSKFQASTMQDGGKARHRRQAANKWQQQQQDKAKPESKNRGLTSYCSSNYLGRINQSVNDSIGSRGLASQWCNHEATTPHKHTQ